VHPRDSRFAWVHWAAGGLASAAQWKKVGSAAFAALYVRGT